MVKLVLKNCIQVLMVAFAIFGILSASVAADDPDALVKIAWGENPSIMALDHKIEAANQRVTRSGAWKDPVFAVEYSNVPVDSFTLGDHAMSGINFKLLQTFTFPGKIGRRENVALAKAEVAKYELAEKKNQIRGMIKSNFWNLTLTRHLKEITNRHIKEVELLVASVESRYETGAAGQHDLYRLMVLKETLVDELSDFHRKEIELLAALNTLLSRPLDFSIETPDSVHTEAIAFNMVSAYEMALQSRPLISVWTAEAKAGRLAAKSASYEGVPDPTIWAGYRLREEVLNNQGMVMDEGGDFFSVGISFPIPFSYNSTFGAAKRESLAKYRSAESMRAAIADQIQGDLGKAYAKWQRAVEKSETYLKILLPGQKQTLNATLAAYQVGRADFTSLFAAQVGLLNIDRGLIEAKVETKIQQAYVETLIGNQIPLSGDSK